MSHNLKYYNYSQCYARYTDRIMNIRQAKIHGEIIVAKPVLMLALIDGVELGVFTNNRFVLNEWLEEHYMKLMLQYTLQSQFDSQLKSTIPSGICPAMAFGIFNRKLRKK